MSQSQPSTSFTLSCLIFRITLCHTHYYYLLLLPLSKPRSKDVKYISQAHAVTFYMNVKCCVAILLHCLFTPVSLIDSALLEDRKCVPSCLCPGPATLIKAGRWTHEPMDHCSFSHLAAVPSAPVTARGHCPPVPFHQLILLLRGMTFSTSAPRD